MPGTGGRPVPLHLDEPGMVSTACPYCLVMLGDAIMAKRASGEAKGSLELADVARLLARYVRAPAAEPPVVAE